MHATYLTCLGLFESGKFGLDWAIPLGVLGLVLIFAEIFIPSGGTLTISSACCMVAAIVAAYNENVTTGTVFLGAVILGTPIVLVVAFKLFPHTPIGKRMIVDADPTPKEQRVAVATDEKGLLGLVGTAKTVLRPAGSAIIAGDVHDVVTAGEMIEAGTTVQVIEVEGNRIVVRAVAKHT